MRALLNTKMAEGTLVQDHVLKMIVHLNELDILGDEIDGESQVNIRLMSQLESFKNFRLNYSMSKGSYSLAELLKSFKHQRGFLAMPRVHRWRRKVLIVLQRRIKRKKRLPSQVQAQSRSPK